MAVGLAATTLANKWLDMLSGTAFTAPVAAYIKLHIGDPGAAAANNAAGGSTTRVVITFAAASAGSKAMNGTLPVWTNTGGTEVLSHISQWDAITTGNFLLSGALTATQSWSNGNTFTLSSLSISLTPLAA